MEREKRPRRSAAMKLVAAVEPGGEEFHLDQVSHNDESYR